MFRLLDKVLLIALLLALVSVPTTRAAAQLSFLPPPPIDAEVCSETEIILSFNPVYEQLGLDFSAYFFSYFNESVTITRMYPDMHICDPATDPHQLAYIYRVQAQGGPFQTFPATFYRQYLEQILMGNTPVAVAVELDCHVSAQTLPEGLDNGWHQHNIQLDTSLVTGLSPKIAVLDTGLDPSHPVFANTVIGPGYNHYNENGDTSDQHGHGTAMAGLIAHLAPDAEILPYKVLHEDGVGYWGAVGRALLEASHMGADVANLSLGAPRQSPYFFNQVIAEVTDDICYDVTVVAAAGNRCDTGYNCPDTFYPAMMPEVLSVMAYDHNGLFFRRSAGFLNDIDMSAPGVSVCVPWSTTANDASVDPYRRLSGSSIASAQVAAVAGLDRAQNNNWHDQDVRAHLISTGLAPAESVPYCGGKPYWLNACETLGHGGCVYDVDLLTGFGTDRACEAYAGPPALWDYDWHTTVQSENCPASTHFYVVDAQNLTAPAMGFCPEDHVPELPCIARVTSQPNRRPCPDCDADIYSVWEGMFLTLKLRSFDLVNITDMVVRVDDGHSIYSYQLDTSLVPTVGTTATLNYWVYLNQSNGPNLNGGPFSVSLVTYFHVNNRNTFTVDPLNVNVVQ